MNQTPANNMFTRRTLLLASALSPVIVVAQDNKPATKAMKTPYDFGARGGAVIASCTLNRGDTAIPGITAKDAGKTVMIAGGGLDARSLVAKVQPDGSLDKGPARDLTNTTYHMGFDDGPSLQRFLAAGGGLIPDDVFLCQKPPLKYRDNCEIRWQGTILIGEGWPSGFALMGNSYGWTGKEKRLKNIIFRGEGSKPHILLSPANSDITPGRKGIGITCTDQFELTGIRIVGGVGSLFALQIHYSTSGIVRDCHLSVDSMQLHQGSDGIHFIGNCQDIHVSGLTTWTADDSSSQTSEIQQSRNTCIQRITYENCTLENYGHSGIKALLTPQAEASIIQDIEYKNCKFVTYLAEKGNGVPFIITNNARQQGGVIRRITVTGGETIVDNQWTKEIGAPAIVLEGVDEFTVQNHSLLHCGRTAILAENCSKLRVKNVRIKPKKMLSPPSLGEHVPLIRLTNCVGAEIDTSNMAPSYNSQPLTSS